MKNTKNTSAKFENFSNVLDKKQMNVLFGGDNGGSAGNGGNGGSGGSANNSGNGRGIVIVPGDQF